MFLGCRSAINISLLWTESPRTRRDHLILKFHKLKVNCGIADVLGPMRWYQITVYDVARAKLGFSNRAISRVVADLSTRNDVDDYSDPDVIRVGDYFFMTASSFNAVPGLPILQSKDLVNWKLVAYVFTHQPPLDVYSKPQHGNGVWAPSIRFHAGEFYIYYPDPDYGIYLVKAKSVTGPWSELVLIKEAKGWIDPCPLWDDDGKAYLVSAMAASRSGVKSILVVSRLSLDGTKVLDDGVMVFDGHDRNPTVEGPKFYKRNGYYYIFAPAGVQILIGLELTE